MKNTELQIQWRERISTYRKSGLSAKVWCDEAGVSFSSLKYWITRLNKANPKPAETKWTQVNIVDTAPLVSSTIIIHVGVARIEVLSGFDKALLTEVLKVAKSIC